MTVIKTFLTTQADPKYIIDFSPSYSVSNIPFNFDQDTTLRRFWYDLGAGCEKLKLYTLFCLKLSKVYFSVSEIDTPFSTCHNIHNIWRPNVFLCNEDMRLKKVFQRWHSEAFHVVCILKTGEMCLTLFNIFLSITDIEFLINKGKVMLEKNLISNFFFFTFYVFQIWLQDKCKKYMPLI